MSDWLRVRRAYELGRLRAALPWALVPLALSLLSCTCCAERSFVMLFGASLAGMLVLARWRGGVWAAAAPVGLGGGVLAWLAPFACPIAPVCAAAAFVVGIGIGLLARTRAGRRVEFLLAASLMAALGGAMGCLVLGLAGLGAAALALAIGAVPTALVPAKAAS
jgi:hypothetical protein